MNSSFWRSIDSSTVPSISSLNPSDAESSDKLTPSPAAFWLPGASTEWSLTSASAFYAICATHIQDH
eukprot:11001000-Ditylum_brightwellii.AAC.1